MFIYRVKVVFTKWFRSSKKKRKKQTRSILQHQPLYFCIHLLCGVNFVLFCFCEWNVIWPDIWNLSLSMKSFVGQLNSQKKLLMKVTKINMHKNMYSMFSIWFLKKRTCFLKIENWTKFYWKLRPDFPLTLVSLSEPEADGATSHHDPNFPKGCGYKDQEDNFQRSLYLKCSVNIGEWHDGVFFQYKDLSLWFACISGALVAWS